MIKRTFVATLALLFVATTVQAASTNATSAAIAPAQKVSVKMTAIAAAPQFTVRVPVRLVKIGAPWKRGAVTCDYAAMHDIGMPNILNPGQPGSTTSFEQGSGTVAKAFALSGDGNYNGTLSLGWSWPGTEAQYRQTYKCMLLVTESTAGDDNWYDASSAGIVVDSGSAYRTTTEGEIK